MRSTRQFLNQPSGASAVEYALMAGLISIAIVFGAGMLGAAVSAKFTPVGSSAASVRPT
jgi:pilus assembly protein Flp/PilA